ncbi:hypothetical protein SCUCBS95973_006465 [Sporothrix curviconia]|uniref:EGF domain-specific O-linked N-acetylglucosamine transferase n=1 Tax=Sporothrix curviconia TaxID=1260050 RepID=A0ABP0C5W8_9PEZI
MLLSPSFKVRRILPTAVFGASLVLCLGYLYLTPHEFAQHGLPWPSSSYNAYSLLSPPSPLPLPDDYSVDTPASSFCEERFNSKYLIDLRSTSFQYCNASSYSSLTCFHSHTSSDDKRDSLCLAQGAAYDPSSRKFVLQCDIAAPDANATARGVIPFAAVRQYWYATGPRYIFDNHVSFVPGDGVVGAAAAAAAAAASSPKETRFTLLIKREGEMNPWHCLLEIWSMAMTMDVLQMSRDPATGRAFWRSADDKQNMQVVILDDRLDGPYFDLWTLFSGRPPLRIKQLATDPGAASFYGLDGSDSSHSSDSSDTSDAASVEHRLIVPLAGASNPIWQNDWTARDCTRSETLRAFVGRVLRHYGVVDKAAGREKPAADNSNSNDDDKKIRVTFVDRKDVNTRRLADQDRLLDALRAAYGGANGTVRVDAVDFGTLPFAEQLRVARATDVLVGVHGAGLTHTMFLREQTSAVVEIQPSDMAATFMGFRNLANMRGVAYFRTHASPINEAEAAQVADSAEAKTETETETEPASVKKRLRPVRRASWHTENFAIDTDVFVRAVGAAIEAVANKGVHKKEVS